MANERIGYFKTLRLGDYLKGPELIRVVGEDPEFVSALYADRPTVIDRGGRSHFEVEAVATLQRGFAGAEASDVFMTRKIAFAVQARQVRGYVPSSVYTTEGILAVLEDVAGLYQTTGSVSAGAATIPLPVTLAMSADDHWYITDGTSFELMRISTTQVSSSLAVDATTYAYASGAYVFKPTWYLRNAFLLGEVALAGNDPGTSRAVKDIGMKFSSVEDLKTI